MQLSTLTKVGVLSAFASLGQAINICMAEESLSPSFPGNGGAENVGWQFWPPGPFPPCDVGSHEGHDSKDGELRDQLPCYFELYNEQGFILHWNDNTVYNVKLERNGEFYEPVEPTDLCDYFGHDYFARRFLAEPTGQMPLFECN